MEMSSDYLTSVISMAACFSRWSLYCALYINIENESHWKCTVLKYDGNMMNVCAIVIPSFCHIWSTRIFVCGVCFMLLSTDVGKYLGLTVRNWIEHICERWWVQSCRFPKVFVMMSCIWHYMCTKKHAHMSQVSMIYIGFSLKSIC